MGVHAMVAGYLAMMQFAAPEPLLQTEPRPTEVQILPWTQRPPPPPEPAPPPTDRTLRPHDPAPVSLG